MSKVMLADDAIEEKIRFPCGIQPKIDGVRGYYPITHLLARSNKVFRNKHTQALFSNPIYQYLDGEFAAERETHPRLCSLTTSATSTHNSTPYLLWHLFDYLHPLVVNLPYELRYAALVEHHKRLEAQGITNLRVIPMVVVYSLEELLHYEQIWLNAGYEGLIIRDLKGMHKQGRSTVKQMGLLRIKRFIDFEFIVRRITEGQTNLNEATTNERGHTTRSSHQENMVPNGMVGNLIGDVVKDVLDPQTKKVLLVRNQIVTISPGEMDHGDRQMYFKNQHLLIDQIGKAKFFPKGHKDQPRFPIWQGLRSAEDM